MMLDNFLISPILHSLSMTLFHFLWQGLLIAFVLKIALSTLAVKNSNARYLASSIAMLMNLLVPLFTFFVIYRPTPTLEQQLINNNGTFSSATLSAELPLGVFQYASYVSMIWMFAVLCLSLKIMLELRNVNQLTKQNIVMPSNQLLQRFSQLIATLGLKKNPRLLLSLRVTIPMAIGWIKPVVILPASMATGLTPAQLDMLLLHELAHIRRHDYLVNFIQTLVETLLFFHPAVFWVSKQMRNEREYCSDDIAVHHCGNPIAYAHTLADTACLSRQSRPLSIPSFAMAASGGDLKLRVIRLVKPHHCTHENKAGKLLAGFSILIALGLGFFNQLTLMAFININAGKALVDDPIYNVSANERQLSLMLEKKPLAQYLLSGKQAINEVETPNQLILLPKNQLETKAQVNDHSQSNNPLDTASHAVQNNKSATRDDFSSDLATRNNELEQNQVKTVVSAKQEKTEFTKTPTLKAVTAASPAEKQVNKPQELQELVGNAQPTTDVVLLNAPQKVATDKLETISKLEQSLDNLAAKQQITPDNQVLFSQPFNTENIAVTQRNLDNDNDFSKASNAASEMISAKLLNAAEPRYPYSAKKKGIELDILVNFEIDSEGRVSDIEIEHKYQSNHFRAAIRTAMSKWRFIPAKENGKAVESRMSKIFSFNLS